jgi:hypothetical protein
VALPLQTFGTSNVEVGTGPLSAFMIRPRSGRGAAAHAYMMGGVRTFAASSPKVRTADK